MKPFQRLIRISVCAGALIAALLQVTPAPGAATRQIRLGPVIRPPAGAHLLGKLPDATLLRVTVALTPRDPPALAAFASSVSTPGSPAYRDYLSVSQFARRFGATAAQITAVQASLRAHGLVPGHVNANALSIPVSASAGALARAFAVSFMRFELPSGRIALTTTAAPLLDESAARHVQAVLGLETLSTPQPRAIDARAAGADAPARGAAGASKNARPQARPSVATGGPQPCAAASSTAPSQHAYTADQIASAYRYSGLYHAGDLGAGQTIALYELEPNDPADIAAYQACYKTSASVQYLQVDGGAGSGGGSGEAALDIEDVIGLAPRAKVLVYQGPNSSSGGPGSGPYDTYSAIITQDRANVISTSWGTCESMQGAANAHAENTLFQEAAAQGQSILAAAGDSGSEDCKATVLSTPTAAVDDPASQPFVTGVGGTTLSALGPPPTEVTWNNGGGVVGLTGIGPGASGGGVSALWSMPGFQAGAPSGLHVANGGSSGTPCGASSGFCREVPDLSADADPNTGYLIYYNGSGAATGSASGWQGIGGSSASAPTWAALLVLANASQACSGLPVGFANPALYRVAGSFYGSTYNDVTSGNNDYTGTNGGRFAAGPGYDMATGIGTPVGSALAARLCAGVLRVRNPGAQRASVGVPLRLRVRAADYAGAQLAFSASGLPAGLSMSRATGLISGTPRKAHTALTSVRVTDTRGQVARITFNWTVKFATVLSSALPLKRCSRPAHGRSTCTFSAPRHQTVSVRRGKRASLLVRLLTVSGAPIVGAIVSLSDGSAHLSGATNRSGVTSFRLAAGGDRAVALRYAGAAADYGASLRVVVRNH